MSRLIDADALKELFSEVIGRIAIKPEMNGNLEHMIRASAMVIQMIDDAPTVQPDDDRLERCRFEYINACKIVTYPTPDTTKKDIADAYAVVRALNPIFGEEGF